MTANPIATARLANQRLDRSAFSAPVDVVRWLCGIQAQDYKGALWSVGLRLPDSEQVDIEKAVAQGAIIRTWAMRGTLHLLAADDAAWILPLLAPRIINKNSRRYRQLALDEATLERATETIAGTLRDGRPRTRQELRQVLEDAAIPAGGQRLVYMLQRAALDGLVSIVSETKNKAAYGALDLAAHESRYDSREAALAELARRYFTSHGPATLQDFVWWSGLLTADAKAAVGGAGSALEEVTLSGQTYWIAAETTAEPEQPVAHCLPGFDPYLVDYRDRSAMVDEAYAEAWSRSKAMFTPSLVDTGQVIGLWRRKLTNGAVQMTFEPFRPLSQQERGRLRAAAEQYGRFLARDVRLDSV